MYTSVEVYSWCRFVQDLIKITSGSSVYDCATQITGVKHIPAACIYRGNQQKAWLSQYMKAVAERSW